VGRLTGAKQIEPHFFRQSTPTGSAPETLRAFHVPTSAEASHFLRADPKGGRTGLEMTAHGCTVS
jgi:hypothetical protein